MIPTIAAGHIIYAMSPQNPFVLRVADGGRVRFETCDCFTDQIQQPSDTFEQLDWYRINPSTSRFTSKAPSRATPCACVSTASSWTSARCWRPCPARV